MMNFQNDAPRTFSRDSIRAILENIFYAGQVARYRRSKFSLADNLNHPEQIPSPKIEGDSREILEIFPGQHEPLISVEAWEKTKALREARATTPRRWGKPARVYPLSGVARCWECFETLEKEFTLRGSTGANNNIYYRCAYTQDYVSKHHRRKSSKVEGVNPVVGAMDDSLMERHKMLRADELEHCLDQLISKLTMPQEWNEWIAAYFLSDDGIVEFERAGYKFRLELEETRDLFKAGHIALPEFERRTRVLQEKLASLKSDTKPEAQGILKTIHPFDHFWRELTNEEKRVLLGTMFAGLYFDHEGRLVRAVAYEPFRSLLDLPEDGMLITN